MIARHSALGGGRAAKRSILDSKRETIEDEDSSKPRAESVRQPIAGKRVPCNTLAGSARDSLYLRDLCKASSGAGEYSLLICEAFA